MLGDQLLELAHDVGMASEGEVRFDPPLERQHAELLETSGNRIEQGVVREVGERRAAPQGERLAERRRGTGRISLLECPAAVVRQLLESLQVESPGLDANDIPGAAGLDRLLPQGLAQPGDVPLDEVRGRARRVVPPETVDQPRRGNDDVGSAEEQDERRPLLGRAEPRGTSVHRYLQRAEHAILDGHRATILPPPARPLRAGRPSATVASCACGPSYLQTPVSACALGLLLLPR